MEKVLIICAVIMIVCILLNKLSGKIGIPMLFGFIVIGMLFGSDGIFKIYFDQYEYAGLICSAALIFIMFYGGFGTRWRTAKPVAPQAVLLSTVGVAATAGLAGLFCFFVLKIDLLESLLIGSVLSSTDAASVFSVLRSKKLSLKHSTDAMLELESGSNDPFSYMLTVLILSIMGGAGSATEIIYMLFVQIIFGILAGALLSYGSLWFFRVFKFDVQGLDMVFMLAVCMLSYALPAAVGGNGYLSVYIVGIVLGNSEISNKKSLVHFFDGITGFMQLFIFFLLGLLSFPSQIPSILLVAFPLSLFLIFIARPLVVGVLLAPFRAKWRQMAMVSWAGLRGASSIVFAIMATVSNIYTKHDLFHIVFCVVLISLMFQGTLLPYLAKKTNMMNADGNVMKTFNDYNDSVEASFIRLFVHEGHVWAQKQISQLPLPPDTLVALIVRNGEALTPGGKTIVQPGDILVLSALTFTEQCDIRLTEVEIDKHHEWNQKKIRQLQLPPEHLVVLIYRNGKVVIPKGTTPVRVRDILVLCKGRPAQEKSEGGKSVSKRHYIE